MGSVSKEEQDHQQDKSGTERNSFQKNELKKKIKMLKEAERQEEKKTEASWEQTCFACLLAC